MNHLVIIGQERAVHEWLKQNPQHRGNTRIHRFGSPLMGLRLDTDQIVLVHGWRDLVRPERNRPWFRELRTRMGPGQKLPSDLLYVLFTLSPIQPPNPPFATSRPKAT